MAPACAAGRSATLLGSVAAALAFYGSVPGTLRADDGEHPLSRVRAVGPRPVSGDTGPEGEGTDHALRLSDEAIPFEDFGKDLPRRPRTITEVVDDSLFPENVERRKLLQARPLNDRHTEVPERESLFGRDRFLAAGPVDSGIQLDTGARWRPSFLSFGTFRSAGQSYEAAGGKRATEWANRLDLFGNLYLTSTERLLVGFRPLDDEGVFTGVAGGPGTRREGFTNGLNFEPTTFFFEGFFDELFPNLDPGDHRGLDFGFSVGRQPIFLQDGILADDSIDSIGITKHNLFRMNASASRISAFAGFNELHRNDNRRDSSARFFALSGTFDYPGMTLELDAAYVNGSAARGGDGAYFGIGHLAQLGYWHSTSRLNASFAMNSRNTDAVADGWLLTHQLSRTLPFNEDVLTFSTFYEIDNYTSAARGPATGGPLGGFSLLHRAVGIGTYGPPIETGAGDLFGLGVSYQHFFDEEESRQVLIALGGSGRTGSGDEFTSALALHYQQALTHNLIWSVGGFASVTDEGDKGFGARTELLRKF